MDVSRSVHQAPADSLNLPPGTTTEIEKHPLYSALCRAALELASARINQRSRHLGRNIPRETFCMECGMVQVTGGEDTHLACCRAGQVFLALANLEKAERMDLLSGPGVGGYTPLCVPETISLTPVQIAELRLEIERNCGAR